MLADILTDWESLKAHEAFNASSAFPPFLEEFKKVAAGDFSLWHVDFQPSVQALHKVCYVLASFTLLPELTR